MTPEQKKKTIEIILNRLEDYPREELLEIAREFAKIVYSRLSDDDLIGEANLYFALEDWDKVFPGEKD